ncbi:MAG: hypothetical protein WC758_07400 [Candidatus Woesearchaeota archaeon]|jgi:hypothetical protein
MTAEQKVIIIRPQGAQGGGFSVLVENKSEFIRFDEEVGKLPIEDRKKVEVLKYTAHKIGLSIVDN